MKQLINMVIPCVFLTVFNSCVSHELLQSDTSNTELIDDEDYKKSITLKVDDKISISFWNHNDLSIGSVFNIYNSNEAFGKWLIIDQDGMVKLPRIGVQKLKGLTIKEAETLLQKKYSEYINEPIIVIKILNREVTVLGEVVKPGSYLLEKRKNYLLELLGRAEGTTYFADNSRIKLIRDDTSFIIDISNEEDLVLQNFIVHNGDIIYVPPRRGKTLASNAPTLIPFASLMTGIAVLGSFLLR